jgi:hypothetical protein
LAAAAILRVWLEAGHGASNAKPGRFDPGAQGCGVTEYEIVSSVVSEVLYRAFSNESFPVDVAEVPFCNSLCLKSHPRSSHLGQKIKFINENLKRRRDGRSFGEVVVSLHMNSADSEEASGVEVLYSHAVPARRRVAAEISRVIANALCLPDRGPKSDRQSARGAIAILNKTECPAYLIEMGFVTNPEDVERVRESGVAALISALEVIAREHGK